LGWTMDRNQRATNGHSAEQLVLLALAQRPEVHYVLTGQEHWLPRTAHDKLRFVNGNPCIDAIRHFPDISTDRASIQVKAAPDGERYPTVTIEQASYNVSNILTRAGWPVLLVWLIGEPRPENLYAQWASNVTVTESSKERHELNGSHTPMYLVRKSQLRPFAEFRV